ncbi:Alpha-galactosidase, partial [termite gut metagenome]
TKVQADGKPYVRVSTDETDLIFQIADNGRFYQLYLGAALSDESEFQNLPDHTRTDKWEAYPASGAEDFFEPAFAIRHNDGNPTSVFNYVSHEVKKIDDNVTETIVLLRDKVYPVEVKLYYTAFAKENIIKLHTEIVHQEKNPVVISRYASSMLYLENPSYYLTEFSGDWAKEAQMSTQELKFGKKIIDTKLGSRAAMFAYPFFELGLDAPARENEGDVLMGTISWTGNYRFTFEVDNSGYLRVISGINPYASDYELKPKEVFSTPEFVFTLSHEGTGKGSRNFHDWAINYQLRDGKGDRYTLLNNWENTHFDFDENKLGELMQEASQLGVDLFLLDDGWFGNKYPRKNDRAGLGDWEVTHSKLPNGVPHLVKKAQEAGVKFGIWIEPEMVNPKSELF